MTCESRPSPSFIPAAWQGVFGRSKQQQPAPVQQSPLPTVEPARPSRPSRPSVSRIPASLRAVFLASNRGEEVHEAPREASQSFGKSKSEPLITTRRQSSLRGTNAFFRYLASNSNNVAKGQRQRKKQQQQQENNNNSHSPKSTTTSKTVSTSGDANGSRRIPGLIRTPSLLDEQPVLPSLSPQGYLDAMLQERGYSTERYHTLQTAYYNDPTPLQLASYDIHLVILVRKAQYLEFAQVMTSGISPNPCNMFGESLVHMVCRRGDAKALHILVHSAGCSLQVADDYGRTPLHDACWAVEPVFETVQMILEKDLRLFYLLDARGHPPLSYVRKEHWAKWIRFLDDHKDFYWPTRNTAVCGAQGPPALTLMGPNTRPLENPPHALPLEVTGMVASGRMTPREAQLLINDDVSDITLDSDYYDDQETDSDSDDDEGGYFQITVNPVKYDLHQESQPIAANDVKSEEDKNDNRDLPKESKEEDEYEEEECPIYEDCTDDESFSSFDFDDTEISELLASLPIGRAMGF